MNVIITADRLGALNLVEEAVQILRARIVYSIYPKDDTEVKTILEVVAPRLFSEHVCVPLKTLKNPVARSIATAFKTLEELRDRINHVLCQYPDLNKKVMLINLGYDK
jgi:hypothetical protein